MAQYQVGNLIRFQLLADKEVRFAGYQMPHPRVSPAFATRPMKCDRLRVL